MPLDRRAGRHCGDGIGFPPGCAGLTAEPNSRCIAQDHGRSCLLCVRTGETALPCEIDDRGWDVAGRSVQAVQSNRGRWLVATFVGGRWLDPAYPMIRVQTKRQAIDLAWLRARQIEPRAPILPFGNDRDAWRCGNVMILVAEVIRA